MPDIDLAAMRGDLTQTRLDVEDLTCTLDAEWKALSPLLLHEIRTVQGHALALADEVERLRAENAALRENAGAVRKP
jgi:hypothetical protein